eukprot:GEMP01016779.1.p1 GENE.GEMP01016779.1~~GEMP01016779.1.p1  ORF type:complete len:307 (+),score=29.59 GEMP01016779.1:332-1252(+)
MAKRVSENPKNLDPFDPRRTEPPTELREIRLADILQTAEPTAGGQEEKNPKKPSLLYRTKKCSYYESGSCKRGEKCAFAHGEANLRRAPDLYKTQLCEAYLTTGACQNKATCSFAHGLAELQPMTLRNEDSPTMHALQNLKRATEPFAPNRDSKWSEVQYVHPQSPLDEITTSTRPAGIKGFSPQSCLCGQCGPSSSITSQLAQSVVPEPFFIPVDRVTSSSYSSVIGFEDASPRWASAHSTDSSQRLESAWPLPEPVRLSPPSSPQVSVSEISRVSDNSSRLSGNVRSSNRKTSPLHSWDEADEV